MTSLMKNLLLWTIALVLFSEFFADGFNKLYGRGDLTLAGWGYSCSLLGFVGIGEIVLASGLLIPRSRIWAALFIGLLTLISLYFHWVHQDVISLLVSIMNVGLAAIVIWYSTNLSHAPVSES